MRPRPRDRTKVMGDLRCALAGGAIGLDTFELRADCAQRTRSRGDLSRLTADLPVPEVVHCPPDIPVGDTLVIGRHGSASLVIRDPKVSRRHLRLRREVDGWTALDLDSTNGTFVNGWRIERARLSPTDELQVGDTRLRIVF